VSAPLTIPRSALRTVEDVLPLLQGVQKSGRGWTALCPAHADTQPSLSISVGRVKPLLLKCHRGCPFNTILAALCDPTLAPNTVGLLAPQAKVRMRGAGGLAESATYAYHDLRGRLAYQVVRLVGADGKKTFRMRQPDGQGGWLYTIGGGPRYLYRLHEFLTPGDGRVRTTAWLVEGEKDADTLWEHKLPALCNCGGAGKWLPEYTEQIVTASVTHAVILPDNDEPGAAHGELVATALLAAGLRVKVVALPVPPKGDATDFYQAGGDNAALFALVRQAPDYARAS
jgi:hypothetical protein